MAVQGTLVFAAGELEKTVYISVIGDRLHEADEVFFVRIKTVINAVISQDLAIVTISNDDLPLPKP